MAPDRASAVEQGSGGGPAFDVIHSIDSVKLAYRLKRICDEESREELPVLVQVDLGGEETKVGDPRIGIVGADRPSAILQTSEADRFTKIADWKPGFSQQEMNGTSKEFLKAVTPIKARYVRVRAHNFGKIPSWHLGAGGDPWIFVDEIFIR